MESTGNDKNSSLLRTIVNDCFTPIIFSSDRKWLKLCQKQNLFLPRWNLSQNFESITAKRERSDAATNFYWQSSDHTDDQCYKHFTVVTRGCRKMTKRLNTTTTLQLSTSLSTLWLQNVDRLRYRRHCYTKIESNLLRLGVNKGGKSLIRLPPDVT